MKINHDTKYNIGDMVFCLDKSDNGDIHSYQERWYVNYVDSGLEYFGIINDIKNPFQIDAIKIRIDKDNVDIYYVIDRKYYHESIVFSTFEEAKKAVVKLNK